MIFILFHALDGCISRFMYRKCVKRSIKLSGQAGGVWETVYDADMEELRAKVQEFDLKNVCNANETGILYAVISSRSFLLATERRNKVRGSALMKSKKTCYAYGLHKCGWASQAPAVVCWKGKVTYVFWTAKVYNAICLATQRVDGKCMFRGMANGLVFANTGKVQWPLAFIAR